MFPFKIYLRKLLTYFFTAVARKSIKLVRKKQFLRAFWQFFRRNINKPLRTISGRKLNSICGFRFALTAKAKDSSQPRWPLPSAARIFPKLPPEPLIKAFYLLKICSKIKRIKRD